MPPTLNPARGITAFDPNLRLPRVFQWNFALDQALGSQQTVTASYVGAVGRRLIQTAAVSTPSPNFSTALLVTNSGTSDYHALQIQFQRRLSRGLQALASYTWSHSIDTGSAGSGQLLSNALDPSSDSNANRAPSDFDIQARSAAPVDVSEDFFSQLNGATVDVRPDLVAGQPLYLFGSQCLSVFGQPCPGGRGFNPAAFTDPPVDPDTGDPIRQGTLPRNALRGFAAFQWDFAIHRTFQIRESLRLQFLAEMFNMLTHPNLGPPNGQFGTGSFGLSTQMLGQSLNNNNLGSGAFSPLYQIGGPRSIQFGLKLLF